MIIRSGCSGENAKQILYWEGAITPVDIMEEYGDIIKQIKEGNYSNGLNLEKLCYKGEYKIYSVRANSHKKRLILAVMPDNTLLFLRERLDNHKHKTYLKRLNDNGILNQFKKSQSKMASGSYPDFVFVPCGIEKELS
jgi:hypothetical protein